MRVAPNLAGWLVLLCVTGAAAQNAYPPRPAASNRMTASAPSSVPPGTVKAVLVKSWEPASGLLVWDHLNSHWADYGTTPIVIDVASLGTIPNLTFADLQASGADVVILSDSAGGAYTWSSTEISALEAYAGLGHPLVGTFLLLKNREVDDRALARLWGLRPDLDYLYWDFPPSGQAVILEPSDCLFRGITTPLDLGGYPQVAAPTDDHRWDDSDLAGASFVARSQDGLYVVTRYEHGSLRATYISSMPEFQTGTAFEATQLLYDAITCASGATPTTRRSWGRVKALYR